MGVLPAWLNTQKNVPTNSSHSEEHWMIQAGVFYKYPKTKVYEYSYVVEGSHQQQEDVIGAEPERTKKVYCCI